MSNNVLRPGDIVNTPTGPVYLNWGRQQQKTEVTKAIDVNEPETDDDPNSVFGAGLFSPLPSSGDIALAKAKRNVNAEVSKAAAKADDPNDCLTDAFLPAYTR